MYRELLSRIWENGPADPKQRYVLLAIADHVNRSGETATPSYQRLADMTGYSRPTVIKLVKGLASGGYITVEHRRRDGRQTSNGFAVNLEALTESRVNPSLLCQSKETGSFRVKNGAISGLTRVNPNHPENHPENHPAADRDNSGEPAAAAVDPEFATLLESHGIAVPSELARRIVAAGLTLDDSTYIGRVAAAVASEVERGKVYNPPAFLARLLAARDMSFLVRVEKSLARRAVHVRQEEPVLV